MKKKFLYDTITITMATCLIVVFSTLIVLANISLKISKEFSNTFNFVQIISELNNYQGQLQSIENIARAYRISIILSIVIFLIYLVYILVKKQEELKTIKFFSYISYIGFSIFLIYITKNFFYAIKSINNRLYSSDFSKTIFLMSRMQELKNVDILIYISFLLVIIFNILTLIFYLKTSIGDKKVKYISIISILFVFMFFHFNKQLNIQANRINPFEYYTEHYTLDSNNNFVLSPLVNTKKAYKKYLDLGIRNIFENGMVFEVENNIKNKDNINVKFAYDVEKVAENGLVITKLEQYVKNNKNIYILSDYDKLNTKSLKKLLKNTEIRFIDNAEENTLYYNFDKNNNIVIYIVQKILVSQLDIDSKMNYKLLAGNNNNQIFKIIYLGNIFVDDKNVISYTTLNNINISNIFATDEKLQEYINKEGLKEGIKWKKF